MKNLYILILILIGAAALPQFARAENLFFETWSPEKFDRELISPQSVFVVNTTGNQSDVLPGDGFCNDGSGNCSLRAAIQEANVFPGANQIDFSIPGSCPQTLTLTSPLPDITETVAINGYSQPEALPNTAATGSNAQICVQILGNGLGSSADGLRINASAPNTIVRGLAIGNFGDNGIEVSGSGSQIEGNFVGTDASGTSARPNFNGVVTGGTNIRVGGSTLLARNVISGNQRYGVSAGGTGNFVQNNQIGLGATSAALGNGNSGVLMFQSGGHTIGGATAALRNVISGNGTNIVGGFDGSGVYIFGNNLNQSPGNIVQGNYVGTNPSGTAALPNQSNGIKIEGAINTAITGNLVSGNAIDGIGITGAGATGTVIQGNTVGLAANGVSPIPNVRDGIGVFEIAGNTVGGTTPAARNYSAANGRYGIFVGGTGAENNLVQGNYVGLTQTGTAAGNATAGIIVFSANNTVGGTTSGARNFIGAQNFGVVLIGGAATGNLVQGNWIGVNEAGNQIPNFRGVQIQDAANNTIGGTSAGAGNLISGNANAGIYMISTGATVQTTGNQIQGNLIGTNAAGTTAVPNGVGVFLQQSDSNTIGGTTAEARNLISGNTGDGVAFSSSKSNQVLGNYIGTTLDGANDLGNSANGVFLVGTTNVTTTSNLIGGAGVGAGNLISGNNLAGVRFSDFTNDNQVRGNVIGLNSAGNSLPNSVNGVTMLGTAGGQIFLNYIGSLNTANAGNVISGNAGHGVFLSNGSSLNYIVGNRIGTNAAGTHQRANSGNGVLIDNSSANYIGAAFALARNVISGNLAGGIRMTGPNGANFVTGNYIGTNAAGDNYIRTPDGANPTSNLVYGIRAESPDNIIGGATTDSRNVISGHFIANAIGVDIFNSATATRVQNNYIGTNGAGDAVLTNGANIVVTGNGFKIDSNLISGALFGINVGAINFGYITNNQIGTNAAGTALLGNGFSVYLNNSSGIRIGQDENGQAAPNVIAGSTRKGVAIFGNGTGNLIRQNSIYDSADLGIDLGDNGVTQNDQGDTDLANNFQNFPVLGSVMTTIDGTLNSHPNSTYRLEFFSSPSADSTGYGEGKTFITNVTVNTNSNGNASFSVPNPIPVGGFITATATDLATNDTSEFSAIKQVLAPTAVKFAGAQAEKFADGVSLRWQTGMETDNLGFNVYRERDGKREAISDSLVAGSALLTNAKLQSGFEYQWFDRGGTEADSYYIEAVDADGSRETFGAFRSENETSGRNYAANSRTLVDLNESIEQKTREIEPTAKTNVKPNANRTNAQNSIAQAGGVRIGVKSAGFYRVAAADLFARGLPAGANPNNLALYADGIEQPLGIVQAENGAFSGIEFYGVGIDSTETSVRNYQLIVSTNPGRRLEKFSSHGAPSQAGFYLASVERRDRNLYASGIKNGDEENFFGAVIGGDAVEQILNVSELAGEAAQPAKISVTAQGLSLGAHQVRVELNGQFLGQIDFASRQKGTLETSVPANSLREGANRFRLVSASASDISLVDNIRVEFPRRFRAAENTIRFTAEANQEITLGGFTDEAIRVFDVTDAANVFELDARVTRGAEPHISENSKTAETSEKSNVSASPGETENAAADARARSYNLGVTPIGSGTRTLLAAPAKTKRARLEIEPNYQSDLKKIKGGDLVIITKREFLPALETLAKIRQSQNFRVVAIDIQDIYDEFNFSQKSTASVRDFLRFASENWAIKPQYLLLAGDASYDPKNYLGGAPDIVPTKSVDTLTMETASDEWFADFDGDDIGELAIGRLPAANVAEIEALVNKLAAYERQTPVNSAAFVSDVSDGFDFAGANTAVRGDLPAGFGTVDLRRGEMSDATVKNNLIGAINSGQKLVSYVGHGSNSIWRGNILSNADALALRNADRLPIFVTMTCLNGFFQDPFNASLSEALLKNPYGGAIGVLTASGAGLPDSYGSLNVEIHRRLLGGATLGEAHRQSKRTVANRDIVKTWVLLGDPTMRLK